MCVELAGGAARFLEVAHGQHDLDAGRQQPGTLEGLLRLIRHAPDRGGGGGAVALRQPQERQARLWLEAEPACGAVGLLGSRELPLQALDFPLAVEGAPREALVQHTLAEALTGLLHLFQSGPPGPLELHDLGAMHQADAGVRDHVGLAVTPLGQRIGPLAGAAHVVRVLTERDRVAVDDAGDDRRQLARRDGHHGLVHQPEALLRPALPHQGVALPHPRDRDEVRIAVALADRGSLRRRCMRGAASPLASARSRTGSRR